MRRRWWLGTLAALACVPATAHASVGIQAHRGGPYVDRVPAFFENTLPAFEHAAEQGFVLEADTKLTADGVPVVIHDATLDRTTNCTGPVASISAADLRASCRADVRGVPGNPQPAVLGTVPDPGSDVPVPTLAEFLALARDRGARVNLEIKNIPTDGDFEAGPRPAYATRVLDEIDASGIPPSRVIIQSFWPANLDVAEARGFETSLLTLNPLNPGGPDVAKAAGYEWVSPGWPVDPAFVSRAHALGRRVVPYTLDLEADLQAAAAAAVDEVITNDPVFAARTLAVSALPRGDGPPPPSDADCREARAARSLDPIVSTDPKPGAPRVFAMQFKQDVRHVLSYETYRTKIECMVREWVVPRLASGRPNIVAFNEDVGLATIATGSRGRAAREIFADPERSPSCQESAAAPCGAFGALAAVGAAYAGPLAAYEARFSPLHPVSGAFTATTDTFARGWMTAFSDIARRYGVYILGSNTQAPFRESTDPAEIAVFADPDLPEPPESVYVATGPEVYNEAFLWAPRDVRTTGPRPLRNVVASNRKVPLTPIEELLEITPGPSTGPDAVANVAPYAIPGTSARLAFATSLPAFVYGDLPAGADPCADVARFYMRCLDKLGANLVLQDEANPGPWAAYTSEESVDRGAWQPLSFMSSVWRAVTDPAVGFAYDVAPYMVGNLADLPFDGQTSITQRGLSTGPGCHHVGTGQLGDRDPATFEIGGETQNVAPYAGPKTEFLALAPWVVPDAPRPELQRVARDLGPDGDGPLENDYLETAIVADLPFPPNPRRPSCATGVVSALPKPKLRVQVTPRRVRAGSRTRFGIRVTRRDGGQRRPVRRAKIRFAGKRARTDRRGRARITVRLRRSGRLRVRATKPGFRRGRATVRVTRRARRGPRFVG